MNPTKGYYCLVQYCPDIARQEAANVGVVLFCPEYQFLQAKLMNANGRIRKFFGDQADDYQHLNAMKKALANRLQVEKAEFGVLEDLQRFVETRANKIVLTLPKPVKVFDAEQDLAGLYKELVDDPVKHLTVRATNPLRDRLDAVLLDQTVKPFLKTDLTIEIPAMHETLSVPYGFQNNRFNLIYPVEFNQQSENGIKKAACTHAVEGLSLYRHPDATLGQMQLVVVADFTSIVSHARTVVNDIFAENQVRIITPDGLNDLKTEIVAHGKRLSP
jgi:hypothetical protein